jgi:GNAT superfamily N-acetyltransferase
MDDAGRIAAVLDDCTRHYLGRPSSLDDALGRLRQGDPAKDFRLAIDSDGNPVGFGHVWAVPPHEVRGFVRVRPSAKGRGVGAALLLWLEGWDETDPCIHGLVEDARQSARVVSRVGRLRAERLRSKQPEALSRRDRLEPGVRVEL